MKIGKRHVIFIVAGILCIFVSGRTESSVVSDKPSLAGQVCPALTEVERLYVDLHTDISVSHIDVKALENIHEKVEGRLDDADIKIISRPFADSRPIFTLTDLNPFRIAKLRVDIRTLEPGQSQQCVFFIQTSLAVKVYLTKSSTWLVEADVWKASPVMQVVAIEDVPDEVLNAALEQVGTFIQAYLAANPQEKQASDLNDINAIPKEQDKPAVKSIVAEHKFVASNNSKVFHKPSCRWAKRIKPENLVVYNSREEAIRAGRRPCRTCEP